MSRPCLPPCPSAWAGATNSLLRGRCPPGRHVFALCRTQPCMCPWAPSLHALAAVAQVAMRCRPPRRLHPAAHGGWLHAHLDDRSAAGGRRRPGAGGPAGTQVGWVGRAGKGGPGRAHRQRKAEITGRGRLEPPAEEGPTLGSGIAEGRQGGDGCLPACRPFLSPTHSNPPLLQPSTRCARAARWSWWRGCALRCLPTTRCWCSGAWRWRMSCRC